MFNIGQIVVCILNPTLTPLWCGKQYIVEAVGGNFVKLEGVKGKWHSSRFILVSDVE